MSELQVICVFEHFHITEYLSQKYCSLFRFLYVPQAYLRNLSI
jgi:hypothetical protein